MTNKRTWGWNYSFSCTFLLHLGKFTAACGTQCVRDLSFHSSRLYRFGCGQLSWFVLHGCMSLVSQLVQNTGSVCLHLTGIYPLSIWGYFRLCYSEPSSSRSPVLSPVLHSLLTIFDPANKSSFHSSGQTEMMHCITAAFMKVFISYLKCFYIHLLCYDLQKEKESSFTGGKTATCEN